jgi:hypothetical protein
MITRTRLNDTLIRTFSALLLVHSNIIIYVADCPLTSIQVALEVGQIAAQLECELHYLEGIYTDGNVIM